jgi:hypothetical protein
MPLPFKLNARAEYTLRQRRAFDALSRGKRLSTKDLVNRVYRDGDAPPRANNYINTLVTGLGEKMERNREKVRLRRTKQRGSRPIVFWLEVWQRPRARRHAG